jgi:predicted PurR-regulated permease PerM
MRGFKEKVWPINQLMIFIGMSFLIIFSLQYASEVIVPFLISLVIAIIFSPLFGWLESKKISKVFSLFLILTIIVIFVLFFSAYVFNEAKDFITNYQEIKTKFLASENGILNYLQTLGLEFDGAKFQLLLEQYNLLDIVKKFLSQANSQFSNIFVIVFMILFMLLESESFHKKILKITHEYGIEEELFFEILDKVKNYFIIKVKTSLLTGILVFLSLWYFSIPYYFLWAVLAFFLNFIPVVGSILASIPALVFAFMSYDFITTVWVGSCYLLINMLVGNFLEPRIMGKGLGMSALVIFISMIFWGWIFGPTGMILSVPLTMVLEYLFAQYKETQWIALLLSDYKD